uniref:Cytochrome P450 n=1 Tax=Meloidogyne javanica TaxID=6303 RepID=A0A915LFK9_MELJA
MRDYGIDKDTVEKQVLDAIFRVIDKIKNEKEMGKSEHSIDREVDLMTGSIINQIMLGFSFYGERFKEFSGLKQLLDIQQVYFISFWSLLIEMSPWIRHIPIYVKHFYNYGKKATESLFEYSQKEIEKRIEARKDPNYLPEEGMDVLDQFLESVEETDQNDPENYYKVKYLTAFVYDMFLAGQETTSNTINFLILYLMLDQSSQEKLQNELDKVMEEKRGVAEETGEEFDGKFRQSDPNKDVKIGGHNLKAGTVVIPQISTVLFDERIFPDPEKFIPERFLDENGQFKKIEENIPFGVGKSCVGEALARMELFLFTANFFYKFHVYPPNPLNPPKYEKRQTFAVKLPDYNCSVELRN